MKVSNLNIGTRLGASFALVLLLMLAVAAVSIISLTSIGRVSDRIINEDWVKVEAAYTINATMRANARRNMEVFFAQGDARKTVLERIAANRKTIDDAVAVLDRLVETPEGKEILAQFKKERQVYVDSFSQIAELTETNRAFQAREVLNEVMLPALDRVQITIQRLVDRQTEMTTASGAQMATDIERARLIVSVLTIVALLLGGLLAFLITRSITRPLNQAVSVARTVASGDLSSQVKVNSKDETGQLLEALQSMNASLVDIVGKVRSGTDSIAGASAQIAAGNEDLSSRTEEQAASLTETAASMEEITSTVKHNADNAQQAHTLAVTASKAASDGGEVVSQAVDTMQAIHESSRKIVDIISVIDGIAFQTNILALNAAVEAARAGEQGRGFAVVASEVRTLAQRSAAAAKEIKELIENSVERIDQGSTQVSAAGDAMNNIVGSIKRVADIMSEITNASHEQTRGIEQVNVAISQMDEVTQQNSALVEEAAAASQSLQEQASELARVVSVFRLSGSESSVTRHEKDITPKMAPRGRQVEHSKPRLAATSDTSKSAPKTASRATLADEPRATRKPETRKPEARRTETEEDWETF